MPKKITDTSTIISSEGWEEELQELKRRHEFAANLGGPESVARQHDAGRLTIRERISSLADPDSFQEVGKLTGQGHYVDGKLQGVTPAPYVMGLAQIDARPVAIGGEDFTVRGGSSWSGDRKKEAKAVLLKICLWTIAFLW